MKHTKSSSASKNEQTRKERFLARLRAVAPYLPTIAFAFAFLFAIAVCAYFILFPAEGFFHSDCTDSLFWAEASYDAGAVFNPDFKYAALLPFGASLWLVPLIALFGVTMKTHVIGMMIFLLLFAASIIFLCRRLRWSYAYSFGCGALMLLILSSSEKLLEIMWNHVIYYSLGLLLYFVVFGLAIIAVERMEEPKHGRIRALLPLIPLTIFCLLNALNGFQMLVLTVIPVCAGFFGERFLDRTRPLFSKKNIPTALVLACSAFGMLLGVVLLDTLLGDISAGYANAYSTFSAIDSWGANADKFFINWLTLLGVSVKTSDSLVSGDSIINILRIGVGILLTVVPLLLLCFYNKIENRYIRILTIGHAFLLAFLLFGSICGKLGAANWRLTPLLGSSVITTVAAVKLAVEHRKKAVLSCRIGVVILLVLAMLGTQNARWISAMPKDYGRDNDLHLLSAKLEEEGLTYGYATFWRSQAITVLSDSRVKVREILVNKDEIETDYYQSQGAWYEDQEGGSEYFILLSHSELTTIQRSTYWRQLLAHCLVRDFQYEGYFVYVFAENIWHDHTGEPIVERPQDEDEDPDDGHDPDAE